MTQGGELAIVAYNIGFLPLIKLLKAYYTDVTHPWYVCGAGALGAFDKIGLHFNWLKQFGPGSGYYPETSKIILIIHPDNLAAGKEFGLRHRFKVCTGMCYLGGFMSMTNLNVNG